MVERLKYACCKRRQAVERKGHTMNRSSSQKALLVIAIINIVFGAFALIAGLMSGVLGVGVGILNSSDIASAGVTGNQQAAVTAGFSLLGIVGIVDGILTLVEGILGLRAANDNQKIMPVWILAIASLVISALNLISGLFSGKFSLSLIVSVIVAGLMFWIANNIKQEAGR